MKVTILMPVYNGEKYLSEQIESFLSQTYKEWELIIRNDGSNDNSQSIINIYCKRYPDKIKFVAEPKENLGLVKSLNVLLDHASSDYIMLSDQDDVWLPEKIEISLKKVQELEGNGDIPVMICTDAKCVDTNLNVIEESFFESQKFQDGVIGDTEKMMALNEVQGCTVMINKKAKEYICPLPDFMHIHDMWIGIMISHFGKVAYIPQPTLLYRQHDHNTLGSTSVSLSYYLRRTNTIGYFIKSRYLLIQRLPFKINFPKWLWYKLYYAFLRMK